MMKTMDNAGDNLYYLVRKVELASRSIAMTTTMPVLFVGHGNPMNALQQNTYTEGWASLGVNLPRPKAILAISAHWYVPETAVTAMPAPRTIHDFGGFPPELYLVSYPSPGDVALASRIQSLLTPVSVRRDEQWGLIRPWGNLLLTG